MCLHLGSKLTKTQRAFEQSQKLKPYIKFNAEKRKNAGDNFEKDFFNLINNSVYGKTMGNLRNIVNVRLSADSKGYKDLVSKQSFVSQTIVNKAAPKIKVSANSR